MFAFFLSLCSCLRSETKKRKSVPIVLSDSEMSVFCVVVCSDAYELPTISELVEPSASSANKRAKISPPSPGSKEFQLLPAVSLTYVFSFINFTLVNSSFKGTYWTLQWLMLPLLLVLILVP